jgi:uncharacterized protein YjiS (DUF1127 family)
LRHCSYASVALHNPSQPNYIRIDRSRLRALAEGGRRRMKTMARNTTNTSLYGRVRRWRRYRDTVRELKNLSPRELNDLGIFPADIGRLAREASRL